MFDTIPIDSIKVGRDDRQRRKLTGIEELAASITRIGLLHPPVVTGDLQLVVGERRLTAAKLLGWTEIPVQFKEYLDPATLKAVELEENLKRVDLTWQDTALSVEQYHQLKCSENDGWSFAQTADSIGMGESSIRKFVMVAGELRRGNPAVVEAPKYSVALNNVTRMKERQQAAELDKAINTAASIPAQAPTFTPESVSAEPDDEDVDIDDLIPEAETGLIFAEDFNEWAPLYTGPKFNLIHCDFPYGVNADQFNQGSAAAHGGYKDSEDVYWRLLDTLCNNIDRIASPSCHLVFWFSMDFYEDTLRRLRSTFDRVDKRPLIWYKSDGRGIIPDANRGPRWSYETALLCTRGDRKIVRPVSNVAAAPITSGTHMSEKTQSMLEHFFTMLVDEHTTLLDPTCGSGSSLRAGLAKGASRVMGLELNPEYAALADEKLRAQINGVLS